MKRICLLLVFLFIPIYALGQFKLQSRNPEFTDQLKNEQGRSFGILGINPSRFNMSHSYSMSYLSVGGKNFTQGLYLNTMSYQFTIPLTLSLQLGVAHQPFQAANFSPVFKSGPFIAGAQLKYQPTANTVIQLDFHQSPYQNYPWGYNRSLAGWNWVE